MKFQCKISTSDSSADLGMEIWIDQQQIFDCDHVVAEHKIEYELGENQDKHQLRFVLKNKKPQHTVIDENQQIVKDAVIVVDQVEFDEINVDQLLYEHARYEHNLNTNFATSINEKFYGTMGCNGSVIMDFDTPVYVWVLEHM
jgi:hypothetical protein